MPAVFISYRREESAGEARALFNELVEYIGEDSVFMDVDSIALGQDFRDVVRQRLSSTDMMLALVGKEWLTATTPDGRRRLDDPGDFVCLEIGTALARKIPVTPVLLHGTPMPSADQLPEVLRDFAFRNAFELSHTRWESDLQEMLRRLHLLAPQPANASPMRPHHMEREVADAHTMPAQARSPMALRAVLSVIAVVTMLGIGSYVYQRSNGSDNARAGERPDSSAPAGEPANTSDDSGPLSASSAVTPAVVPSSTATTSADGPTPPRTRDANSETTDTLEGLLTSIGRTTLNVTLGTQAAGPERCLGTLAIFPCADRPGQKWVLEPAGDGHQVRIHNEAAGMGKCLDIVNDATNNTLTMAPCGDYTGQRWTLAAAGTAERYARLQNEFTGPERCLAAPEIDGRSELRMVKCAGAAPQRWRLTQR